MPEPLTSTVIQQHWEVRDKAGRVIYSYFTEEGMWAALADPWQTKTTDYGVKVTSTLTATQTVEVLNAGGQARPHHYRQDL